MKLRTVAQTLSFGLALALAGHAETPPSISMPRSPSVVPTPFNCVEAERICWYLDESGELQGAANTTEIGMGLALASGRTMFLRSVDAATLTRARTTYSRIRDTLRRRWTVAARMMVSDAIHANMNILALTVSQIVTEWNEHVRGRIDREIAARNNVVGGVAMTAIGAVSFSLPGGVLLQCAVMNLLVKTALPALLESNGYTFSELPREFSSTIQGIAVDRLESDIQRATDLLLGQVGLSFLAQNDGERRLREASEDQRAQVNLLGAYAGTPFRQADLGRTFKDNRDFRLLYAAKVASVVGPRYEEQINSFIVTGFFSEMAWASNGISARGVIFDLYDVPAPPAAAGQFAFLMDIRHKRRWRVTSRWTLEARDHGSFMEGRFGQVRLILPYWDEAVVPYGEEAPRLRGSSSG